MSSVWSAPRPPYAAAPGRAGEGASPAALRLDGDERRAVLAVVLACCYPLLLTGLHTNLMPVGTAIVGAAEVCILALTLPLLLRYLPPRVLELMVLAFATLAALWLLRGAMDFKSARDFLIPACFLWLGIAVGSRAAAERALWTVAWIALAVGLFELAFVDVYARFFNVLSYYVAQGAVIESAAVQPDLGLSLNGLRPEGIGRTLFPALLGSHRVSSIFIEPVSMGNFATLLAAWGLSKGADERRGMWAMLLLAWVLIVLADSRYGLVVVSLMAVLRLATSRHSQPLAFAFPFVAVIAVCALALIYPGYMADDFLGRLALSGRSLLELGWQGLLGLDGWASRHGDAGYAYLFTRFGLPLAAAVWVFVWMLPMRDEPAARFRAHVALYMALILTVSGTSMFAMKTSALLWFLVGVGVAGRMPAPVPGARARPGSPAAAVSDPVTGRYP